ncbi:hypothetical protein [Pseudocitrobacter sp. MW920760]|uniref:hypothetical protein n=1 Tax=Pseudocitrobacter sp. MW920760 TaxID=2981140 RepID=UPI003FA73553
MKRYFTTLMLSTLMTCSYASAVGLDEDSESSALPTSNVHSPLKGQSAKIAEIQAYPDSHVTPCYRIYIPDRKPGINCIPDASTGH